MLKHPNIFDRLALRIYPRYLYRGQTAQVVGKVGVGVVGRVAGVKTGEWKIMSSSRLLPGSLVRFLGLARDLKVLGRTEQKYSVFEVVKPVADPEASRGVAAGDTICVTPVERQWVYPGVILKTS